MHGFTWLGAGSPSRPGDVGDRWCVRDSVCRLFGWPVGSQEWSSFVEGPEPEEVDRLVLHLGIERIDPIIPHHFAWLLEHLEIPAISGYNFAGAEESHFQYEPRIGSYRGVPPVYYSVLGSDPVLVGFLVHERAVSGSHQ